MLLERAYAREDDSNCRAAVWLVNKRIESSIMPVLMLMCCVWLVSAGTLPKKCDRVTFDGKYYEKELLTTVNLAINFSYQKGTNTLFFSYGNATNNTEEFYMGVAYYNIDTNELTDIPEIPGGITTAIDTETDEVYLGGEDGIRKFNPQTNETEPYTAVGVNIFYMYFDSILFSTLFYTTWPNFELFRYGGDGDVTLKETNDRRIEKMIGDEQKYYFLNETGIFRMLADEERTVDKFADKEKSGYAVFARDNNKKIFVARWDDGVYTPNELEKKLDKVADIERVRGLAFDKENNIIYSDNDHIYKLTLIQAQCSPA